jgi:hypothetical protein
MPVKIFCSLDGDSQRTAGMFARALREQFGRTVEVDTVVGLGKQPSGAPERSLTAVLGSWYSAFRAASPVSTSPVTVWCVTQGKVLRDALGRAAGAETKMLDVVRLDVRGPDGAHTVHQTTQPEHEHEHEHDAAQHEPLPDSFDVPDTPKKGKGKTKTRTKDHRESRERPEDSRVDSHVSRPRRHDPANMLGELMAPLLSGQLAQHGAKRAQQKDLPRKSQGQGHGHQRHDGVSLGNHPGGRRQGRQEDSWQRGPWQGSAPRQGPDTWQGWEGPPSAGPWQEWQEWHGPPGFQGGQGNWGWN